MLLTPPSAAVQFRQGSDLTGDDASRTMFDAQWPMTFAPVLGLPGVTVPTGLDGGLPTGIQLVGARFSDDTLLDIAGLVEDRAGTLAPVQPVR